MGSWLTKIMSSEHNWHAQVCVCGSEWFHDLHPHKVMSYGVEKLWRRAIPHYASEDIPDFIALVSCAICKRNYNHNGEEVE